MLKRLAMMLATAALILSASTFTPSASTFSPTATMVDRMPMAPEMPCKNTPLCCIDGLGCASPALLPLPQTLPAVMLHFYPLSPPLVAALSGITIEPELSPPIRAL